MFWICSDGLTGQVSDPQILETVRKHLELPEPHTGLEIDNAVRNLISQANENGGDDNITSVLIEVL